MMSRFAAVSLSSCLWIGLITALLTPPPLVAQQGARDSAFERANVAFEQGDFTAAEKEYRRLVEAGHASEQLFFNLGNAVYRQDRLGEAALWFQRALVLDPRMPEARQNLRVLKHRAGYLEFEPEGIDAVLAQVARGELVALSTAGLWLALLLGAGLLVFRKFRDWRPFLLILIGLLPSAFFFISRDVYATIVFHNFLGVFGVIRAFAAQDKLSAFQVPQWPLIGTAAISLAVLVLADKLVIRRSA